MYVGIDVGSVSVKTVILDKDKKIVKVLPYTRHYGEPVKIVKKHLEEIEKEFPVVDSVRVTGAGGKLLSHLLGVPFVNELPAQTEAAREYYPHAKCIIDIGGEDSKFIDIEKEDFAMNELCAAGTGAFLDQQASRMGYTIEEFAEVSLKSKNPPRIAGRCTVFAKTDMIHLQQEATPDYDIIAGLHFALARNFKSEIAKGRKIRPPVLFHGGVAFNKGMVHAFRKELGLKEDELIVPEYCAWMCAIGTAIIAIKEGEKKEIKIKDLIERLEKYLRDYKVEWKSLPKLSLEQSKILWYHRKEHKFKEGEKVDAYIGIDVGSTSTKVAAIDENGNLLGEVYLWTSGRPIEAVRECLRILNEKIGKYINVKGAGTTGSGRYLTGDIIGADVVVNEITAQARAAVHIDPYVDTIFEIGGQDSKYISIENGVIVDFEMNKVCAAGTGSFLQEQAERLNVKIEDFGDIALRAEKPCDLGERCTVFMETNLTQYQRKGVSKENLIAGLCYSIAKNYLTQVVGKKRIGNRILFQGAVAFNKGVVAAFEKILGKPIIVPENPHVTGAMGAAMCAMEKVKEKGKTRFRGFDKIVNMKYEQKTFICKGCPNHCEIKQVKIEGEDVPLYYGARCEKYEFKKEKKKLGEDLPDLFAEREKYLLEAYEKAQEVEGPKVGIPYASLFHEYLPFWATFLAELGFKPVLSDRTNKKIMHQGAASANAEFCFPIKLVIGHVINLLEKNVDFLFLPSIIDTHPPKGAKRSYICPYNQEIPHIIMAALRPKVKILNPVVYFRNQKALFRSLVEFGREIGKDEALIKRAIRKAQKAQEEFWRKIKERGREILSTLKGNALVIVGRSYNTCDRMANLDIPKILRERGQMVIPMDFLPVEEIDVSDWPNMYWTYGRKILAAARLIRDDERLFAVYLTNFGCGPDSFIHQYVRKELGGKPFLQIEIDEHSAPAGVITRCEAFLDSIKNAKKKGEIYIKSAPKYKKYEGRTIYLPHMGDCAYALWAAFRKHGIPAEIIKSDDRTLELGRKYTSGKECYPCVITTGDMLKTLEENDPKKCAFFMSTAYGPCRFGQYCHLQRMILDELGYKDVPIVSPGAPESLDFYREYDMANPEGVMTLVRALQGVVAIDYLLKLRREKRPYEANKGETDRVYQKWLMKICEAIQKGGVGKTLKQAVEDFKKIKVKDVEKPRIAIVGEIFVRSHEYSNNNIERKVEEMGGETCFPPFYEWGLHTANTRRLDAKVDGNPFQAFLSHWTEFALKYFEKSLGKYVWHALKYPEEVDIEEIWDAASDYLIRWWGEPALSVGDAVIWARKGEIDGIINLMPFTCMPGNTTASVFKRVKDDFNIPVLDIAFDGLEQGTLEQRLEAFMYQVKRHKEKKLK